MTSETAPFPSAIRLAKPDDMSRLSIVAYAGASTTQEHRWIRPYSNQYPEDTLSDWQNHLTDCTAKDDWILLVAEDVPEPDEMATPCTGIPTNKQPGSPAVEAAVEEDKVAVGFALFHLRPKNAWTGRFRIAGILPETQLFQRRDVDEGHESTYWKTTRLAEIDHFHDCGMTLESLIVHPTYWRRGHGAQLVQSGIRLANSDRAALGVIGTRLGVPLYRRLGFTEVDHFRIEGDELVPEGVEGKLMKYVPPHEEVHRIREISERVEAQEVKGYKRASGLASSRWANKE